MSDHHKPKIAIIDLGINNLFSITNALEIVGCSPIITNDKNRIRKADAIIIPGVGAFDKAMDTLKGKDLIDTIITFSKTGKYILGICLGMHLIMEYSLEFGKNYGLGLLQGYCNKFDNSKRKVPHIKWNKIFTPVDESFPINSPFSSLENGDYMYFIHSYYVIPQKKDNILSFTEYEGQKFCSAIQHKNIIGMQFHPEKSGPKGLEILMNFKNLVANDTK